jgi:c-di-GMP-binding flagellar brake protein YcgR
VNDTDFPYSRRKHSRNSVLFKAKIFFDKQSISCEILDISAGGARARVQRQLKHGLHVTLNLDPFGEIPCEIAWQKDQNLGMKFQGDPVEIAEIILAMAVYK